MSALKTAQLFQGVVSCQLSGVKRGRHQFKQTNKLIEGRCLRLSWGLVQGVLVRLNDYNTTIGLAYGGIHSTGFVWDGERVAFSHVALANPVIFVGYDPWS